MPFHFRDLDSTTQKIMVTEIQNAKPANNLYFSTRFTSTGVEAWPGLLEQAAAGHDEHWLAYQLDAPGLMKGLEPTHTRSGAYTIKHMPHNASLTMAEGQFNRYYIIAVSLRAIDEGDGMVTVYRAKPVNDPRPESEAMIGKRLDANELVSALRPKASSLRHFLLKPNSGLSVHR